MTMQELAKYKDQHGRIIYRDKFGEPGEWFGYILEISENYVLIQDNELKHQFKVEKIISFTPMKLPEWKQ